jgi:hypothetical protein
MHRQSIAVAICADRTSVLHFGRGNVAKIRIVAAKQQFNIPLPFGSASFAKRAIARLFAMVHDVGRRVIVAARGITSRSARQPRKDRDL